MTTSIVALADVRAHLRFSDAYTQDDDMLTNIFMPAADRVIQRECAEVIPTMRDEYYDGGDFSIWLRNIPVLSVELVEEGWGPVNYDLAQQNVNSVPAPSSFAYSIDDADEGMITRRSVANAPLPFIPGESNIHVVYTSGRTPIPGNIVLAELELINHWYQNAMQRYSGATSTYDAVAADYARSGDNAQEMVSFGVPERILELLKPDRRTPIIG